MNSDLEQAIKNFRANAQRYDKPERYYRGDHDLAFATEKFENAFGNLFREFALNLCPAICDAVRDKLKVTGFSLGTQAPLPASVARYTDHAHHEPAFLSSLKGTEEEQQLSRPPSEAPKFQTIHDALDSLWQSNSMDLTQEEIHLEALKLGDSYAIVWPGSDGSVTIYPQRAANCTVQYDDEMPGRMLWAAKYWRALDGLVRLNIFYPDRIEKYVSRSRSELALPDAREFLFAASDSSLETRDQGQGTFPNPYGTIPLFHFSNTSEVGSFGRGELAQAIPIQNGLNKAVLDMLVAMEFSAFRQRWVTGLDVDYDSEGNALPPFKIGMDRLWTASNPQVNFGDFSTTDLDQFLKVKDSFRVDMASVSGTPLHYFLQNIRGFASGEALGRAEARFLAKVRDRQRAFGQTWSRLMSFALQIVGFDKGIRLRTQWEDPAPIAEREFLENLILKKRLGLPTEQALLEAGYGRADITRMLQSTNVSGHKGSSIQKPTRKRGRKTTDNKSVPPAIAGGA